MPNSSWKMKTWDTWEDQYETNPITDHMIRGDRGTYPDKVEFMHALIDELTENRNDLRASSVMAMAGVPHTKEPGGAKPKFEIVRGQDRLLIEFVEDAKWSVVDDFGPKLQEVIQKAEDVGEVNALASLLEEKIQDIKKGKKRKNMESVD
eukprot:CAMPEP_0201887582 /NCGR_PEP_ID=MMETSP0902-20130614/25280_1 /ASSEMBLY_ACC=CAM_ASM_000551 /TAXON_ID=420261 /ORGANISM="Thalassiosira antarctica, Strain CCMP982" /LENGTH=149 /DNA_ID=CAMNT_0048417551 /DNA_START=102 /DNA_END=551 /DNA_ORIENTATION=+